ncbi:hypothetical protein JYU34_015305, partial [Plutella xylostella]
PRLVPGTRVAKLQGGCPVSKRRHGEVRAICRLGAITTDDCKGGSTLEKKPTKPDCVYDRKL